MDCGLGTKYGLRTTLVKMVLNWCKYVRKIEMKRSLSDRSFVTSRGGGGARVSEGGNHPFLKGKALGTRLGGGVQFSKRLDFGGSILKMHRM